MSEIKHSDGPWGISSESPRIIKQFDSLGESNVIIGSASGYTGSGFFPSDEEAIVNARIMAASLDLLEALKDLKVRYEALFNIYAARAYCPSNDSSSDLDLALIMCNRAIAKATGA
jgi:hypothetical protein